MVVYLKKIFLIGRSAHLLTSFLFGAWVGILSTASGPLINGLQSGVITLMVTAGVFLKNQVTDIHADRISKPYRPLAAGMLRPDSMYQCACILFCLSIVGCIYLSILNWLWLVLLLYCLLLLKYDSVKRRYAWVKGLYVGASLAVALSFAVMTGKRVSVSIFLVILSFTFYVAFRECLLDVRDTRGDRSAGVRTVAVRYGDNKAVLLAELFWLVSYIVLLVVDTNLVRNIVIIVAFHFFSAIAFVANRHSSSWHGGRGLVLQWIPMVLLAVLTVTI